MVRLYLPSKATYITLSLAGIRAPSQRGSDGAPEAFFELARYTVESKLLGRDLNVIVEGAAPMGSNKESFLLNDLTGKSEYGESGRSQTGRYALPWPMFWTVHFYQDQNKWFQFRDTLKETIKIYRKNH